MVKLFIGARILRKCAYKMLVKLTPSQHTFLIVNLTLYFDAAGALVEIGSNGKFSLAKSEKHMYHNKELQNSGI